MKNAAMWLLLTACTGLAAAQQGGQDSGREGITRTMCDAAAPWLHDTGTNKVVLMMTLDNKGRVESFKTEFPKGLRLEKLKEAATAIKTMQFEPAKKDGSPVAVQVRVAFDCAGQPPVAQKALKLCDTDNPPPCADKPPRLLHGEDPQYPEEARKTKHSGVVVLIFVVGTDGIPYDIEVKASAGYPMDREAIKALKKWRFEPGQSGGKPVPVEMHGEMHFRLYG